jgi:hypothetical protein
MCVTVTVVTGHSVALSRRSHLFSTMSSLHDVLVHDTFESNWLPMASFFVATTTTSRAPLSSNLVSQSFACFYLHCSLLF